MKDTTRAWLEGFSIGLVVMSLLLAAIDAFAAAQERTMAIRIIFDGRVKGKSQAFRLKLGYFFILKADGQISGSSRNWQFDRHKQQGKNGHRGQPEQFRFLLIVHSPD